MYTYLKVTVAALRAWRLLHYISSLFLFFLSRYNNFSARFIRLLYKLLARTTVGSSRALVLLLRKCVLQYFLLFFFFIHLSSCAWRG